MLLESPSRPSSWLRRQYSAVLFRFDIVSCPPLGQTVQSIATPQYPERSEMSSPLGTQLSLLKLQFRQCFQLVLRGFSFLFRKHRNHPDHPSAGDLKAFRADKLILMRFTCDRLHLFLFICLETGGVFRPTWALSPIGGQGCQSGWKEATRGGTGPTACSHPLTAFGNIAKSGSRILRSSPHYPSRKNSVVNNQKSKNFRKILMVQGVSLTPCRRN